MFLLKITLKCICNNKYYALNKKIILILKLAKTMVNKISKEYIILYEERVGTPSIN